MKRLYLVENPSTQLLRFLKRIDARSALLLLSPEAVMAFQNTNFNTFVPEEFVKAEELNEMGMRNYRRVREFVSVIDRELWHLFPSLQRDGLRFAYYNMDVFKIIMDSITSRILILDGAIKKLNPEQIYYEGNDREEIISSFYIKARIFSLLLPIFSHHYQISTIQYPDCSDDFGFGQKERVNRFKFLKKVADSTPYKVRSLRSLFSKNKSTILSLCPSYDQCLIIRDPQVLRRFNVWSWKYFDFSSRLKKKYCDFLKSDNEFHWRRVDLCRVFDQLKALCIEKNINWFSLIEDRIRFFFKKTVPDSYTLFRIVGYFLDTIKPDIVIANSGVTNITEGLISKAINDAQIPRVMVQHGGGGYALTKVPAISVRDFELVPQSYYFMWGRAVKDYFSKESKEAGVTIYSMGSPAIRKIFVNSKRIKRKEHIETVFYLIQNFREAVNGNYYPGGSAHYTDTWYFKLHLNVLDVLKKYKQYKITIKIPPSFVKYKLYENLIKRERHIALKDNPLVKLIHKPDLFIIDTLATSIIQCAATTTPIIVYTGEYCKKPNSEALISLRKRAVCCETEEEFLQMIDRILDNPDEYGADPFNQEFIKLYGIGDSGTDPDWGESLKGIMNDYAYRYRQEDSRSSTTHSLYIDN